MKRSAKPSTAGPNRLPDKTGASRKRTLAGGLIALRVKMLVQPAARWLLSGDHSSPSSLTAFVMMRMSSSSALSLALCEEDDGKRAGSVTDLYKKDLPLYIKKLYKKIKNI